MDVKSAFSKGDLKEEVRVEQPPGFVILGVEDKAKKALYELKLEPQNSSLRKAACVQKEGTNFLQEKESLWACNNPKSEKN